MGKEKVEVRYEYDGNRTAQSDDQSTFLDVNVPLVILDNGYFSRGRYEFPFSLIVPPGVKSSMRCEIAGSKGGFAEIKYFIEARVHRRGTLNNLIYQITPPISTVHYRLYQLGCIYK